jgi:hypothetical protein
MLSSTPVAGDPYWDAATTSCTYQICQQTFGARDQPRRTRDLRILEAWDDHLELEPRIADDRTTAPEMLDVNHPEIKPKGQIETEIRQTLDAMECCFPGVVEFRIRGGNQWIVQGDQVGFLNNVAVRDDGVCRKSCDPELELLNGRALTAPTKEPLPDGDPYAFKNPFFRFAILNGKSPRDMAFRFQTQGAFSPLVLSVVTDNPDVLPTSASFLPNTGKIVISDGVLDGITLLDLNSLTLTGQYR